MSLFRSLVVLLSFCFMSTASIAETPQETRNRELVVNFYQQLFGDKDVSAIDRYIAEDYIQHNPTVPTGRAPIKKIFSQMLANAPKSKVDIRRVAASGDLVWLHVRVPESNGDVYAVVDIFRVDGDRIVEHWDVAQKVPKKSANSNTMF